MIAKPWTTPADLRGQMQRYWDEGRLLCAALGGKPLFPMSLKVRGPGSRELSEHFEDVRQWIRVLESEQWYRIEWEDINHRLLGRNRVPSRIVVPSEGDALSALGKAAEVERCRSLYRLTQETLPELSAWVGRKPLVALEHFAEWDQILAVLAWFRSHPRCGLYLRQLDIAGVDTKFIEARRGLFAELLDCVLPPEAIDRNISAQSCFEERYGLASKPRLIRFRLLDREVSIHGLTDVAVTAPEFASLDLPVDRVFITENEINGLTFPNLSRSMVIFGLGYGLERLSEAGWLQSRKLNYWGDIDTYGFHILSGLRSYFPATESFLMDRATLAEHLPFCVQEMTPYTGPLLRLTAAELDLYEDLRWNRIGDRLRLEQERIRYRWIEQQLSRL